MRTGAACPYTFEGVCPLMHTSASTALPHLKACAPCAAPQSALSAAEPKARHASYTRPFAALARKMESSLSMFGVKSSSQAEEGARAMGARACAGVHGCACACAGAVGHQGCRPRRALHPPRPSPHARPLPNTPPLTAHPPHPPRPRKAPPPTPAPPRPAPRTHAHAHTHAGLPGLALPGPLVPQPAALGPVSGLMYIDGALSGSTLAPQARLRARLEQGAVGATRLARVR